MYKKEELSKKLLERCMKCHHGGQNIFPDCLDVDPITDCIYFDDINDDDPREEDYDCGAYMHENDWEELSNLVKNRKEKLNIS